MNSWPPNNQTVPNVCSHGQPWSLPCAACGRPHLPAPTYSISTDPTIAPKLDRIIELLERLLAAVPEGEQP